MRTRLVMFKHCDCSRSFFIEDDKVDSYILDKISETNAIYPVLNKYKILDMSIGNYGCYCDKETECISELYNDLIFDGNFEYDYSELWKIVRDRYNNFRRT